MGTSTDRPTGEAAAGQVLDVREDSESADLEGGDPEGLERAPKRSLAGNIAALATSQLITWVLTLLWTLAVPRLLGPEAMGMLVIATSLAALVTVVLSFATRDFLVREMVSDHAVSSRLMTTALLTRGAAIPIAFLAAAAYGQFANLDSEAMSVMYLTAAATGCVILMDVALAAFQARERMQFIAYLDVGSKSLNSLGGVLLAVAGFGIVAISSFGLLVALLALLVSLRWIHRIVRLGARPLPARQVLRKAGPYWLVSVLFVAYVWADGLLLGLLVPTEVVGWYGVATRLFFTMGFLPVIVMTASLPRLIAAHADSPERMYVEARKPLEWVVLAGLPIGLGMACTADELVPVLFGADYANAVLPLVILALGLPLTYVNTVAAQVFIAAGRPRALIWLLALASVVNIVLNLVLIPMTQSRWGNGAIGAAGSMLLTEILQLILCLAVMGKGLLVRSTLRRIGAAALATTAMATVVMVADGTPLALQILLGAATFVSACLVLRIPTEQEIDVARRIRLKASGKLGLGRSGRP